MTKFVELPEVCLARTSAWGSQPQQTEIRPLAVNPEFVVSIAFMDEQTSAIHLVNTRREYNDPKAHLASHSIAMPFDALVSKLGQAQQPVGK